ncbi:hypothetical protein ASG29_10100 [Sphingomonas sp. Leaf412]|nr:hypothetical protein ASG29_10100 [Sphingomonas sp. Leaf412]
MLLLWGVAGCVSLWSHVVYGAEAMGAATDYDRAFHRALPTWFAFVYAAAVGAGLLGAIALLARSRLAVPLSVVSLVAVVVQFGYALGLTDLVAVKGAAATVPFPLLILAVASFQLWLARRAAARRWIA